MRYAVIKHHKLQDTVAHVNAAMREGWALVGGISHGEAGYAQALMNREEKALPLPDGVHEYHPHPTEAG